MIAPKIMNFVAADWSAQMDFSATERNNREPLMPHRRKGRFGSKSHGSAMKIYVADLSIRFQGRNEKERKAKT